VGVDRVNPSAPLFFRIDAAEQIFLVPRSTPRLAVGHAGNLVRVGNLDRGAPVDGATVEQVRIGAVRRTIPFGPALRARTEARAFFCERGLGVFTARDRGFIQTLAG